MCVDVFFVKSRFTVVLMKRCPKATKSPYNKLQPSYPHESTCLVAETLMHGPFKIGGGKSHFGGATTISRNLKKGRNFLLFWGQNEMEICSTKMAFSAPYLERTMHEGFRY